MSVADCFMSLRYILHVYQQIKAWLITHCNKITQLPTCYLLILIYTQT